MPANSLTALSPLRSTVTLTLVAVAWLAARRVTPALRSSTALAGTRKTLRTISHAWTEQLDNGKVRARESIEKHPWLVGVALITVITAACCALPRAQRAQRT